MLETPIQREYVRTDNWSVTAKVSKDENAEQWVEVQVPNLAAGGLLFLSKTKYDIGDILWFDLLIDPMTPGITRKIPMKAKGEVRGDRGETGGTYSYSVVFTEISKGDRIRLDELVHMTNYKYKLDAEADIFDR